MRQCNRWQHEATTDKAAQNRLITGRSQVRILEGPFQIVSLQQLTAFSPLAKWGEKGDSPFACQHPLRCRTTVEYAYMLLCAQPLKFLQICFDGPKP